MEKRVMIYKSGYDNYLRDHQPTFKTFKKLRRHIKL